MSHGISEWSLDAGLLVGGCLTAGRIVVEGTRIAGVLGVTDGRRFIGRFVTGLLVIEFFVIGARVVGRFDVVAGRFFVVAGRLVVVVGRDN